MLSNITVEPADEVNRNGKPLYHVYRGSHCITKKPILLSNAKREASFERQYSFRIHSIAGQFLCQFQTPGDNKWYRCNKNEKQDDALYWSLTDAKAYFAKHDIQDYTIE